MIENQSIRSKIPGRILVVFLCGILFLSLLSLIFSLAGSLSPSIYQTIEIIDILVSFVILFGYSATLIIFVVWIYLLHVDLNKVFSFYPISPGGSMARLLIPLYNIWGYWNIFSTMARYLLSDQLRDLLLATYIIGICSRWFFRIQNYDYAGWGDPLIWLSLGMISDMVLFAIWLWMTIIITNKLDFQVEKSSANGHKFSIPMQPGS